MASVSPVEQVRRGALTYVVAEPGVTKEHKSINAAKRFVRESKLNVGVGNQSRFVTADAIKRGNVAVV